MLPLACSGCFCFPLMVGLGGPDLDETPVGTAGERHMAVGFGTLHNAADWQPADRMTYASLDGDAWIQDTPLWFTSWYSASYDTETPAQSGASHGSTSFQDLGFGVRHYTTLWRLEPFVGAGVVVGDRTFTAPSGNRDYQYLTGVYGEVGIYAVLHPNFALGVTARGELADDFGLYGKVYSGESYGVQLQLVYRR
ncbi:MAG: hypothetical protein RL398_1708 [Planctomycetota bacterium]